MWSGQWGHYMWRVDADPEAKWPLLLWWRHDPPYSVSGLLTLIAFVDWIGWFEAWGLRSVRISIGGQTIRVNQSQASSQGSSCLRHVGLVTLPSDPLNHSTAHFSLALPVHTEMDAALAILLHGCEWGKSILLLFYIFCQNAVVRHIPQI